MFNHDFVDGTNGVQMNWNLDQLALTLQGCGKKITKGWPIGQHGKQDSLKLD